MNLQTAIATVEMEEIAKIALDVQLGSYDDAIALVEDILPRKEAAKVVAVLSEWKAIDNDW